MKVKDLFRLINPHDEDLEVVFEVSIIGCTNTVLLPVEEVLRKNDPEKPSPRIQLSCQEPILVKTLLEIEKE